MISGTLKLENSDVSNSLSPDQNWHSFDLRPDSLQSYQQTTRVAASKERVKKSCTLSVVDVQI